MKKLQKIVWIDSKNVFIEKNYKLVFNNEITSVLNPLNDLINSHDESDHKQTLLSVVANQLETQEKLQIISCLPVYKNDKYHFFDILCCLKRNEILQPYYLTWVRLRITNIN
ncbi:hypothetical protein [[Mycoplasma] testudinis]|uniref:hypothetical protein n=1 Tax=[Mycoplasma] testudinis TaxID=33924 RepID=UPI0004891BEA|nr:hypothetical protein [[Mycoplasma] testudinis]